jgi:hypothetical protein
MKYYNQITKEKYLLCMSDVRDRTDVCQHLLATGQELMTDNLRSEFVALQLRRILEQIAIASFVANKLSYEKANQKLGAHVPIRNVVKNLSDLNPDFFPKPYKMKLDASGENSHHADYLPLAADPLTEKELLRAHDRCNKSLHSRNPFHSEINPNDQLKYFSEILRKSILLLSEHLVSPVGTTDKFYFIMSSPPDGDPNIIHISPKGI